LIGQAQQADVPSDMFHSTAST